MEFKEEIIPLTGADVYITEKEEDAFAVLSGSVFVFIVPLRDGQPDIRQLLCEVTEGHVIPSFAYRDKDYVNWRFLLAARDNAALKRLPNAATSVLHRRFVESAGLKNYAAEGYENSLIEYYKRDTLKAAAFIQVDDIDRQDTSVSIFDTLKRAFNIREMRIEGKHPLYRAMAYACINASIELPEEEKLAALCGGTFTVPEIAHASRFGCRSVVLDKDWYKKDCGTIIGSIDEKPVACIPRGQERYTVYYGESGKSEKLTQKIAETVDPNAFVLIRTLPEKALVKRDLIRFGAKSIRKPDMLWITVLGLLGVLIGILLPMLNQKIYDEYIPLGDYSQLIQICAVVATFMIGNLFFDMVKKLSEFRVSSHIGYDLQNAVYHRVFRLPESFFRLHESADLAQRLEHVDELGTSFFNSVIVGGMAAVFSLLYLVRMITYSKSLAGWSILMLVVFTGILFLVSRATIRYDQDIEKRKGTAGAKLFQFLNGIEKIRLAGAEDRAAHEYLIPYAEQQNYEIGKNRIAALRLVISGAATTLFSMVFYLIVVKKSVTISSGQFVAFNSAFGAFSASVIALIDGLLNLYQMRPIYERVEPLLNTCVEDVGGKEIPAGLSGRVSFNNVVFAYEKNGTNVLNGITLDIAPGDYVGIVGASGCGKSTMIKLLLGFEEPDQGQICYDGKNLKQLDIQAVRRNLGVVLQNGKLIAGSIYENITITAPKTPLKDVMDVIEKVGLKKDIDQMPMGIHTVLSESAGTISGGQQQRILIARAIISHPSILIFDEATSALDNLTQAAISKNLDEMNITRIVVAHRLSTIKNCKRIIVLQEGRIAEDGDYDSLMKKRGLFYQQASRQLVDEGDGI